MNIITRIRQQVRQLIFGNVSKIKNHYKEEWHAKIILFIGCDKIISKNTKIGPSSHSTQAWIDTLMLCDEHGKLMIKGAKCYFKWNEFVIDVYWVSHQHVGRQLIDTMRNLYAEHQMVILLLVTIHEQLNEQICNDVTNAEMILANEYLLSCIIIGKCKMCDIKINDTYYKEMSNVFGTCFYT
jgi:hypothetical protein